MKLLAALLIPAALASTATYAQTRNVYDWQSGNSYTITRQPSGTVSINGNNFSTGSTWNIQQQRNGSYSGRDAGNNFFHGNNSTGFYQNFGTGRTCFGTGPGRVCN
jgi:hypothetical protein